MSFVMNCEAPGHPYSSSTEPVAKLNQIGQWTCCLKTFGGLHHQKVANLPILKKGGAPGNMDHFLRLLHVGLIKNSEPYSSMTDTPILSAQEAMCRGHFILLEYRKTYVRSLFAETTICIKI